MLRTEKIDELRGLLDLHDRSVVSFVALCGVYDIDDFKRSIRRIEDSGDRAYVFVGPKDKLIGERREAADGAITYTITVARDA